MLDAIVLCPGLHRQQDASTLNTGEFPACAAMTTGYVFRVENPATVAYLQRVGRTGELTTLHVQEAPCNANDVDSNAGARLAYLTAASLTVITMSLCISMADWWAVSSMAILCVARSLNTWVIRSRTIGGWHGAKEPGLSSDLLVLLSYDRWTRIRGSTDDVKAITSGQWLADYTPWQSFLVSSATLMVYLDAALFANASSAGKILLLLLLLGSAALLGLANMFTGSLVVKGKIVTMVGQRKRYGRRRDLADELIHEHKRNDWAMAMGLIVPTAKSEHKGPAMM